MNASSISHPEKKIVYGINTPFFLQHDTNWPRVDVDYLMDNLLELGIEQVRIPLSWFHMAAGHADSKLVWNNAVVDLYSEFFGALPDSITVLAVPLHAPHHIAREYFYNQQAISDQFVEFLTAVNRAYPKIRDWEIWNEPNAGDFYLSVKDKNGHRPWRADEFIEQILIPAARYLRTQHNTGMISAPGFAENGVVGHTDREAVLSNRLPKTDEFRALQPGKGHGHFYFIPGFAKEFLKSLSAVLRNESALIDAIGYHPYPYWQIYTRKNKNLTESTRHLVSDFDRLVGKYELNALEVWITEVGARSLEMANQNARNDAAQADYLNDLYNTILPDSNASRIYWYKLIDKSFDLKQEKTFGLLDIWGNRKKAFYTLKTIQHSHEKPVTQYLDTLRYAGDHTRGGFDPQDWQCRQGDNFAYCIPAVKKSFNGVMVYPGKGVGAQISWESRFCIKRLGFQSASIDLDLDEDVYPGGAALCFLLRDVRDQSEFMQLDYAFQDDKVLVSLNVMSRESELKKVCEFSFNAYPDSLGAVFLNWNSEQVTAGLTANGTLFYKSIQFSGGHFPEDFGISLRVQNIDNRKSFVSFSHLRVKTQAIAQRYKLFPVDDQQPATWTAQKSPYSQIDQDEWVLRATNYKRNGYFVEVGGHDGVSNSNTVLLERKYGWDGLIVEANPRHYKQVCANRNCFSYNYAVFPEAGQHLEFVDAGAVGGLLSHLQDDIHTNFRQRAIDNNRIIKVPSESLDALLQRSAAPELIEFMSVDTEGSEFEVLQSCDFGKWKIALMTVEHGGVESKRKQVFKYLQKYGYQRRRVWFEDWYFHPGHLQQITGHDATALIDTAFSMTPFLRKNRIAESVIQHLKQGSEKQAEKLLKELLKDFYPDNALAYVQYTEMLISRNKPQKAIDLLSNGLKKYPRNRPLLKLGIEIFARENRIVLLARCLENCIKFNGGILSDKDSLSLISEKKNQIRDLFDHHPSFRKNHPNTVAYFQNAK